MKAKKLTALLLTLVMLVSMCSVFAITSSAEAVSADTTWYSDSSDEFTLTTAAQFLGFIQLIQGGTTFENKTVKLGADIDLTGNVITAKMASAASDFGAAAEGQTYASFGFMGTLDGQNHKVEGIAYDFRPSGRVNDTALFGAIAEGKTATIKNIALYGDCENITTSGSTSWRSAGLYCLSRGTLICENVYNALNVHASAHAGAFLGRTTSTTAITRFTNCVVAGTIVTDNSSTSQNVGGFAGSLGGAEATVENCLFIGVAKQANAAVERAAGFVTSISATTIKFKDNIYAGTVNMGSALTGRYYTYSCTEANVDPTSVNNLYIRNAGTSINGTSPKLMPVVDGEGNVTFPEQSTPRYSVTTEQLTGLAAAETLAGYGMDGWSVTTTGLPMPSALMDIAPTVDTRATDSSADYLGYQTKLDGTVGAVRLVGHVDSLENYDKVGMKAVVTFVGEDGTKTMSNSMQTSTVYSQLNGMTETYSTTDEGKAYSGEYFFAFDIQNIKTDLGDVWIEVSTFHVAADGTEEVIGDTYRFMVDWS